MGRRLYVPLRRRHDIPIRRREDIPLRRLGDILQRRSWVFHLRRTCDVTGTYRETSLRHRHDVLLPGGLLHTPLSINSLHSLQHLSSFQRCLLLKTLASNLHLHLHVSCHFMCLVSLVLDIRLNTLTSKFFTTSGTHIFAYGSLILLQLPLHLLVLILKG